MTCWNQCFFFFLLRIFATWQGKKVWKVVVQREFFWGKKWAQVVTLWRRNKLKSPYLENSLPPNYRTYSTIFFFYFSHIAKFGWVLLCVLANPPSSQIWKKNSMALSKYFRKNFLQIWRVWPNIFTKILCMSGTSFFGVAKWQKFVPKKKV